MTCSKMQKRDNMKVGDLVKVTGGNNSWFGMLTVIKLGTLCKIIKSRKDSQLCNDYLIQPVHTKDRIWYPVKSLEVVTKK